MAHKTFISYKYSESQDLRDKIIKKLGTDARVVQSYIILTLGNRTVDGINIELTDFTKRFLDDCGMNLIYEGKRNIYSKRTPKILANNNGSPIFSMNEEYAVIFKK